MMAARQGLRIFVGNLPWTVSKHEVKEYFSQFGYVLATHVLFNKDTGMSKGYGFVTFASRDGYVAATSKETHVIDGQTVTVRIANDKSFEEFL